MSPVNRILLTKTRRDLRRRLAQFAAIGLTVLVGVLLFTASYDAFRNLSASYDHTYDRLHFADFTVTGGDAAKTAAAARGGASDGSAAPGKPPGDAQAVITRTQGDLPLRIGDDKLLGRVIGLPPDRQPAVNQVDVTSGRYLDPASPDGVLVEAHAADTFGLAPGDRLKAFDGSDWREVSVLGVVDSPEYLWPARDRQEVLSDPHAFAVVFAPEKTARSLAGSAAVPQTLVRLDDSARGDSAAEARVADRLRAAGASDVQPRSDQPSNASLHEDLKGFSQLAVAFPVLFLSAAAIAAYVLITRLVLSERRVIATFLAAGAPRGAVVRHYLGHGIVTGAVGAVLGVLLGAVATAEVTRAYTSALGIPDTVVERRADVALLGLLFGALVGLIGGAAPALATARTAPAEAMRGDGGTLRPPGRWSRALARAGRLPVTWRLALRELTRSRRRTVATMTGTVLSLVLVLTSVGMVTSMRSSLEVQFDRIQLEDATVTAAPGAGGLERALRGVKDVRDVEPASMAQVTASAGKRSYPLSLTGLQPDTVMHGFRTTDGGWRDLPDDGLLAGAALAKRLHVKQGDTITVTPPGGSPKRMVLAGLVDEPMGTALYGSEDTVRTITDAAPNSYLLRFADGTGKAARDTARTTVSGLDGVVAYTDAQALRSRIDDYLSLFWIFAGMMLVLGATLALTVIYVTMAVNIAERTGELATLRAAGVRLRRISGVLATENLVAAVIATPLGLVAGALCAWAFLESFNSDLFSLELTLGWAVLLAATGAVLAASLLSQLPAVRAVRRLDIARVVRERAQ